MPPKPSEELAQRNFALHLRFAIDTAVKYPSQRNREEAIAMAQSQPTALRSSHVRHNLGKARWNWLEMHGVYAVGEGGQIEGSFKGTASPDITKESE